MKNFDERITAILLEKQNPHEVAREIIDEKIIQLIPFLRGGDSLEIEETVYHVSFENGERFNGYKISSTSPKAPVVFISKEEMLEAFNTLEEAPLEWPIAINSVKHAFYGLPNRSMYFREDSNGDIQFTTLF